MNHRNVTHASPKYRPYIDGLRGVAIIYTVGYHAFPTHVTGGFIGVDIFFVISGFLISGIIFDALEKGIFSFSKFYARRIRRIFPTMLLMLISLYVAGWSILPSSMFEQLGKYVAAGVGFAVNFVLWKEVGYFDPAAETKPLLHLWSLGIEEQFYILWPALLVLAWRFRLNVLAMIALIVTASFAANVMIMNTDQPLAFYCPLTRLWELLMGAGLAYINLRWPERFKRYANVQSLVGGIFLAIAVEVLNAQSQFPGWWALLPIAGTLLIISAGERAWINRRVLSNRIMVWVGLISYPLYMWHWPLLSYVWVMANGKPSYSATSAAVSISVILAGLTYHLLERNLRFNKHRLVVPGLLVSAMAVFILGLVTYGGFIPPKLASSQLEVAAKSKVPVKPRIPFKPEQPVKPQVPTAPQVPAVSSEMPVKASETAIKASDDFTKTTEALVRTSKGLVETDEEFIKHKEVIARSGGDWEFGTGAAEQFFVGGFPRYIIHASSAKKTLFIGDSHMEQYWSRIYKVVTEHPKESNSALFATLGACPPIPHIIGQGDPPCQPIIATYKTFALRDDVDTVVIAAYWKRYFTNYGANPYGVDEEYSNESYRTQGGIALGLYALEDFLGSIPSGKRVFLVLDNPYDWSFRSLYTDRETFYKDTAARPRKEFEDEIINGINLRDNLKNIAACVGAAVIEPLDSLCPQGMCPAFRSDGGPVYKDDNHIAASYCRDFCDYMDITVTPNTVVQAVSETATTEQPVATATDSGHVSSQMEVAVKPEVVARSNDKFVQPSKGLAKPSEVLAKASEVLAKFSEVLAKFNKMPIKSNGEFAGASVVFAKSSEELAMSSEVISKSNELHINLSEELATASKEFARLSQESAMSNKEFATASKELAVYSEVLAMYSEVLATSGEAPVTSGEVPITSGEVPVTSSEVHITPDEEYAKHLDVFSKSAADWDYGGGNAVHTNVNGLELVMKHASAKTTLFIGDSHTQHYWSRIEKLLKEHPNTYNSALFAAVAGCSPIPHIMVQNIIGQIDPSYCQQIINVYKQLALRDDVDTVVISAMWTRYFSAYGSEHYQVDKEFSQEPYRSQNGIAKGMSGLEELLRSLPSNKRVFLVLDNPTRPFSALYPDKDAFLNATAAKPRSEFEKEIYGVNINNSLKVMAARFGAVVIDPLDSLCPQGMCPVFRPDGGPVYKDDNHIAASYCRDFCDYMDVTVQPRSQ